MYTIEQLKQTYRKIAIAKAHFGVKARGWSALCDKLNQDYLKDAKIKDLEEEIRILKTKISKLTAISDLDLMLTDLVYKRGVGSDEIFESPEALEGEPSDVGRDDWAYFESILTGRYRRLAKRYHADVGGSDEQMKNLTNAYKIGQALIKNNGG